MQNCSEDTNHEIDSQRIDISFFLFSNYKSNCNSYKRSFNFTQCFGFQENSKAKLSDFKFLIREFVKINRQERNIKQNQETSPKDPHYNKEQKSKSHHLGWPPLVTNTHPVLIPSRPRAVPFRSTRQYTSSPQSTPQLFFTVQHFTPLLMCRNPQSTQRDLCLLSFPLLSPPL